MRGRLTWLVLIVAAGVGAVIWTQRSTPCGATVGYRLGQVDARFRLSRDEALEALRQAEALWERALGRDLFTYRPAAALTVNLVYDERQATTQASARLQRSMRETRASHTSVGRSHAQWLATYEGRARDWEAAHAAYQERARGYHEQVQQWNARGGAPPEARARVEAERQQLEAMRRQLEVDRGLLEDAAATVRSLAERGNAIADAHNRDATTFNALYGPPRQFHKGEFNGRDITVFEFHDLRDFTLVLVHELGHALGLGHVDDPAAIMHAVQSAQVVEPLGLTGADVAALRTLCRS